MEDCPSCIKTSGGQHFYLHIFFSEQRTYTRLFLQQRPTDNTSCSFQRSTALHTYVGRELTTVCRTHDHKIEKKISFCKYLFLLTPFFAEDIHYGVTISCCSVQNYATYAVQKKTCEFIALQNIQAAICTPGQHWIANAEHIALNI